MHYVGMGDILLHVEHPLFRQILTVLLKWAELQMSQK
jgi:hypothetical protein